MTVDELKQRIAIIMREKETGKKWSLIGGPRANKCVLRKKRSNAKGQLLSNTEL